VNAEVIDPAIDEDFQQRSIELTNEYTAELTKYCDDRVPPMLDNAEYAARCSALLISMTRQLGRCAAAFAKANNQDQQDVAVMIARMFNKNHQQAIDALGEGETVQ
jgi:hypothetical protein